MFDEKRALPVTKIFMRGSAMRGRISFSGSSSSVRVTSAVKARLSSILPITGPFEEVTVVV